MPAPDQPWNEIATSQTDADSPLDTTLMEAIRQNLIHLEQWLGDGYTAAKDHDHNGTNSKSVVNIAPSITISSQAIGSGASWMPSGVWHTSFYSAGGAGQIQSEAWHAANWRTLHTDSGHGMFPLEGSYNRYTEYTSSGGETLYYHSFPGA